MVKNEFGREDKSSKNNNRYCFDIDVVDFI